MIRLALKGKPPGRLSLDGIIPEKLAVLSASDIARLPLLDGNRRGALGDWFDITIAAGADDRLTIAGDSDRLDDIGAGMGRGEIVVEGNAGASAGLAMTGGSLIIAGSAGHGAATAMRGGEIRIDGDAGDQLGGALPGEGFGMYDGTVIVAGSAGHGAGDRMRRGLVVVAGAVGPFCGARMSAGSIVVGAALGDHPGTAMRRGSIVALGAVTRLLPSFADCGVHELSFQHLLSRLLMKRGFPEMAERVAPLRRWFGDVAERGKGEIFTQV
jgi:formylmethanofuran dehydrogenase subunit C